MPRISVVMPVRNCDLYIEDALRSILNQSFTDYEVIVLDDFSTDDTYNKVLRFAETDQRIVHRKLGSNIGFQNALNIGLSLSDCEFVARHDGDDISEPHRFKYQIDFLEANPKINLIGTSGTFFKDTTTLKQHTVPWQHDEIVDGTLRGKNTFIHASWVMTHASVLNVGNYNPNILAEDKDYLLRFSEQYLVANLPISLYNIRIHSSSITSTTKFDRLLTRSVAFMNFELRQSGRADVFGLRVASKFDASQIKKSQERTMQLGITAARGLQRFQYLTFIKNYSLIPFSTFDTRLSLKLLIELFRLLLARIRRRLVN